MITYMQLTGHCQAGEGYHLGISTPGDRSEPALPEIHVPLLQ